MFLAGLLIWLIAPVVELGVIIYLAVADGRNKKRIEELERRLKMLPAADEGESPVMLPVQGIHPETDGIPVSGFAASAAPEAGKAGKTAGKTAAKANGGKSDWASNTGFSRGTAALVAGVVMIVLAGLIFATTAWHILPDICKAAFVFGFSVLFFAASFLAERFLKIRRTGCAFYILGSIFLMLSVLAVGYFRILGAEFVLVGYHRWRVLCVGSAVTAAALFGGCGKFRDRVYTGCCMWGVTVSMVFFLLSLRLDYRGVACGMMYYGTVLVLLRQAPRMRKEMAVGRNGALGHGGEPEGNRLGHGRTSEEEAAPRDVAEVPWHGGTETWGISRGLDAFAPVHFCAAGIFLLPVMAGDIFRAFISTGGVSRIPFWGVAAAGCLTAGMAALAWDGKAVLQKAICQACCIVFFHYAALWLPLEFVYQLFAGTVLSGGYFLISREKGWQRDSLKCPQGDVLYTAVLFVDTVFLVMDAFADSLYANSGIGVQAAASGAMALLAASAVWWGRKRPAARGFIPLILFGLTVTVPEIIWRQFGIRPEMETVIWAYLFIMMVWDTVKHDRFRAVLWMAGAVCQIAYIGEEMVQIVFLLLFTGYFFCGIRRAVGRERAWLGRTAFAYALESACILADGLLPGTVLPAVPGLCLLAAGYVAAVWSGLLEKEDWFWGAAGVALFALAMGQFSWGDGYALLNLVPVLAAFAVLYVKFYRGGGQWQHFLITLLALPLPFILETRYGIEWDLLYAGVLAAVLVTGMAMRRCSAILEMADDGKSLRRADWFHILIALVLVPMMLGADERWRFAYLLALALYAAQYAALPKLRACALVASGLLLVFAWWLQPFFTLPARLRLEIQLIPVFLFVRSLPMACGRTDGICQVQKGLDTACLMVLAAGAVARGSLANALILECVCLAVFLLGHIRKSAWWIRTAGIIMVAAAFYMTRAFWLNISWWVYLLTAGLGLIGFAAWNETRKRGKDEDGGTDGK